MQRRFTPPDYTISGGRLPQGSFPLRYRAAVLSMLSWFCVGAQEPPMSAEQQIDRGMQRLVAGDIQAAIADFDAAAARKPGLEPHLWQRGIAYYYAKRFADGAAQFESHRRVNPHDVENAVWHYLCVAKLSGVEAAQKRLIPIDTRRDRRVPMTEVYDLFRGTGKAADVLNAAAKEGTPRAHMYAHLYLGLYAEAHGKLEQAKSHMLKAAAVQGDPSYMHQIAELHVKLRQWK